MNIAEILTYIGCIGVGVAVLTKVLLYLLDNKQKQYGKLQSFFTYLLIVSLVILATVALFLVFG